MTKVYFERKSTRTAMKCRYWLQSNEAESAGHPYIVIRPKTG